MKYKVFKIKENDISLIKESFLMNSQNNFEEIVLTKEEGCRNFKKLGITLSKITIGGAALYILTSSYGAYLIATICPFLEDILIKLVEVSANAGDRFFMPVVQYEWIWTTFIKKLFS